MPTVPYDPVEIVEVWFCVTSSDYTAMTSTEANAGVRLTPYITDGPPAAAGSNFLDAGTLASGFQSQVGSTYGGGSGTMTIRHERDTTTTDDSVDTAYNALPRGTTGYLVVAKYGNGGASGQVASGDTCDVYPIEVANRSDNISRGSLATASIDIAFNNPIVQNLDLPS